jgi:hypothetical protein
MSPEARGRRPEVEGPEEVAARSRSQSVVGGQESKVSGR